MIEDALGTLGAKGDEENGGFFDVGEVHGIQYTQILVCLPIPGKVLVMMVGMRILWRLKKTCERNDND